MPMCGFNQEMLESMDELHEGLMEALVDNESLDSEEQE